MEAIVDLPLTSTSESVHTSSVNLENVSVAFGISLLSYIEAEIYVISQVHPVMATIFDLPLTSTSESVHISSNMLVNLENVVVAFGISLLSCVQAEINVFEVYGSSSWIFHIRFLSVWLYNIITIPFG